MSACLGSFFFGEYVGKKSSYFRHSFTAHKDHKIMELIERGGIKCVGVYFVILELYGAAISDDDEQKVDQRINARLIANATGLRADSCRTCIGLLTDCELIEAVHFKSQVSYYQVSVPNFSKYYGKYNKTEPMKCPNKSKVKQSKVKESKPIKNKPKCLVDPQQILTLWNTMCGSVLKKAFEVDDERQELIADSSFFQGMNELQGWKNYFQKILDTPSLSSESGGTWTANFRWAIRRKNILRIAEGEFDKEYKSASFSQQKQDGMLNMENPYNETN